MRFGKHENRNTVRSQSKPYNSVIFLVPVVEVIDPVCGMKVDTERTSHKAVYRGRVYHFCSAHCRRAFEANPDFYLREGPKGMPA